MIRKSFITILTILVLTLSSAAKASSSGQVLTFCYENQELFPHYLTNDIDVPEHKPGAAIEIMQKLDQQLTDLEFKFVRMPWKRCLNQLESGKVDALIGRYTDDRAKFAVYPRTNEGSLDNTKAISVTTSCFIHDNSLSLEWDGNKLKVQQPQGLIAPMGYSLVDDLEALGFDVYESSNIGLAHKLLFNGKFHVSLSDCKLKNKPDHIIENPIPVTREYGYLLFSKQYAKANGDITKRVWRQLQLIDKDSIYSKYK